MPVYLLVFAIQQTWVVCSKSVVLHGVPTPSRLFRHLSLHHNKLVTLPDSIGKLEALRSFVAYHNALTTLPDSISNLVGLKELDVSSNDLTVRYQCVMLGTAIQPPSPTAI